MKWRNSLIKGYKIILFIVFSGLLIALVAYLVNPDILGSGKEIMSKVFLVLEMTDRHSVIFHLMLAALLSNIFAIMIDKDSFYEHLKKQYIDETLRVENNTMFTWISRYWAIDNKLYANQ